MRGTAMFGTTAMIATMATAAGAATAPAEAAAAAAAAMPARPTMAIVTQDQAALRSGPRDSAAQHAVLWQGDVLEVRGQRQDYLQVWDHRRERAGYVRATQVRTTGLQPAEAGELLSVLRFLRDTPGAEALGIAYVAAYLQAVPAQQLGAEPFDALGTMAERLARRAAARQGQTPPATVAAHLEVAAQYGVHISQFEREGTLQPCYDGEAWRRVLALPASAAQRADAALGLTLHECVDPALTPVQRLPLDQWRAQVLDLLGGEAFAQLPATLKNRLRLRRAGVWASLAFQHARAAGLAGATATPAAAHVARSQAAAQRALQELAAVDKAELTDADAREYDDAAIRVGASRWAVEPAGAAMPASALTLRTEPGAPGETCVSLVDTRRAAATGSPAVLARRCTYALVWAASARANAEGSALALAVQPTDTWRELWLFRRQGGRWAIEVLPPSASGPELGYLEFAGWVPGQARLLLARESKVAGRLQRRFEVTRLDTLATERWAGTPQWLAQFTRWQDAAWKRQTVSLR